MIYSETFYLFIEFLGFEFFFTCHFLPIYSKATVPKVQSLGKFSMSRSPGAFGKGLKGCIYFARLD